MNPSDVPVWLQAGGLIAFAGAVLFEVRALRAALQKQNESIAKQGELIAAILEHARLFSATPPSGTPRRAPTNPAVPVIGE